MRLTLRTMLAYLDDVLEPADAAVLGEKIKESDFASNLVSRIRTAIGKQRLGAPPVDGKGIGQDPNSVAEYLDSTLPPDRVPDFELVCLESDAHLAEVAACHQVLTLVLGKPAVVPPHLRERAYRFGSSLTEGSASSSRPITAPIDGDEHRADYAHTAAATQAGVDIASRQAAPGTASAAGAEAEEEPARTEVPEYLREGRRRSRVMAFAVAACALLLIGSLSLLAFQQFYPGDPVVQTDPNQQPVPEDPVEPDDSPSDPAEAVGPAETDDRPPSEATGEGTPPAVTRPTEGNVETPAEVNPPAEPVTGDPATGDPATGDPATGTERLPESIDIPPVPVVPPATGSEPSPTEPPAGEGTTPPATAVAGTDSPMPVVPPATVPSETIPEPPPADTTVPAEVSPVDVGRYLSADKVLARLSPEGQWMRLTSNTPISSGNQLLALPAYRPQIALTSGITLTLDGPTRLKFLRPSTPEQPHVDLKYGHLLAISVAPEGSTLDLTIGDLHGTLRLANTDTMLALEAIPYRTPGADPELTPTVLDINIICLTGRVDWVADLGNAVAIAAGEQYRMRESGIGQIEKFSAPPAWVDDKTTTLPDRDAARMIEQRLVADRPLTLTLSEIVNGPRADLRSLAVRSLAYLDNHDWLIAALNDASQRSSWAAEFDAVSHALARGPQSAAAVRKSLEKERSASAKELYQLLVGFSQDDLIAGADSKLVEYLDHDSQEYRVLAIENLRRITGATHLYRPEYTKQRRKMYVQTWLQDLAEQKIRYPAEEVPGE